MNILKKILLSGTGVALSTTAIVAPLVVLHQNSNNNQIENNTNNNIALLKNGNSVENHLNATNLNKIDDMIDNQMNSNKLQNISMFVNNNLSTSIIKQKTLLIQKAKLIAKQIMDKKINFNDLLKFLKEKQKTIPKSFLDKLKEKELLNDKKINNELKNQNKNNEFFFNSFASNNETVSQGFSPIKIETGVTAGLDTTAAIAATATATAMWCIPFFGWAQAGAATVAAGMDAYTATKTWIQFAQMSDDITSIKNEQLWSEGIKALKSAWKLSGENILQPFQDFIESVKNIMALQTADISTNIATSWGDEDVAIWYVSALEAANSILNIFIDVNNIVNFVVDFIF